MILMVPTDLEARVTPLLSAPYLPGGETPEGWDCAGLVRWCLVNLCGLAEVEPMPDYPSEITASPAGRPERARRIGEVLTRWREVPARPGAVAWLEWLGGATHVGFLVGPATVLHADVGTGTCLLDLNRRGGRWRLKAAFVPDSVTGLIEEPYRSARGASLLEGGKGV
jgi:cell wall-associated NlpC family hydrolase